MKLLFLIEILELGPAYKADLGEPLRELEVLFYAESRGGQRVLLHAVTTAPVKRAEEESGAEP